MSRITLCPQDSNKKKKAKTKYPLSFDAKTYLIQNHSFLLYDWLLSDINKQITNDIVESLLKKSRLLTSKLY